MTTIWLNDFGSFRVVVYALLGSGARRGVLHTYRRNRSSYTGRQVRRPKIKCIEHAQTSEYSSLAMVRVNRCENSSARWRGQIDANYVAHQGKIRSKCMFLREHDSFYEIQHVVPEVTIPPEVTPEKVATHIVDSSCTFNLPV
jgi:hypothetical protein